MGSQTPLKLPLIDFSGVDLEVKTNQWELVKSQVHQALVEYGCFEALFRDKVPLDLRKSIFMALQELFDLPLQTKLRNVSKKPLHGYLGQYPTMPLYESLAIDYADIYEKVEIVTNTLWQEGNPNFSKNIQAFSQHVSKLDHIIRKMILESLGVEKYLGEQMSSTNYLLRVTKYQGPQTQDTKLGLNPHTDKSMVTILYQNQVEGLEVQTKDGEWISVNPSQDSFVVVIGDALYAWANGRLHWPSHRVMMRGNEARYSLGLFSIPNAGYTIKAPEELVDEEHPLLFKPFDYIEFIHFCDTDAGQRAQNALEAYCGV